MLNLGSYRDLGSTLVDRRHRRARWQQLQTAERRSRFGLGAGRNRRGRVGMAVLGIAGTRSGCGPRWTLGPVGVRCAPNSAIATGKGPPAPAAPQHADDGGARVGQRFGTAAPAARAARGLRAPRALPDRSSHATRWLARCRGQQPAWRPRPTLAYSIQSSRPDSGRLVFVTWSGSTGPSDRGPPLREPSPSTGGPAPRKPDPSNGGPDPRKPDPSNGGPDPRKPDPSNGGPDPRKADPSTGGPDPRKADPSTGGPDPRKPDPSTGGPDPRKADPSTGGPDPRTADPSNRCPDPRKRRPLLSREGSVRRSCNTAIAGPVPGSGHAWCPFSSGVCPNVRWERPGSVVAFLWAERARPNVASLPNGSRGAWVSADMRSLGKSARHSGEFGRHLAPRGRPPLRRLRPWVYGWSCWCLRAVAPRSRPRVQPERAPESWRRGGRAGASASAHPPFVSPGVEPSTWGFIFPIIII